MENNKKVIDITNELKKAERRVKWKARLNKAKDWATDNPQLVAGGVSLLGLIGATAKMVGRRHNLRIQQRNKDLRCYDARLGHYWELKRKLSNKEWSKIDRRMSKGERLSDILNSMNVLK